MRRIEFHPLDHAKANGAKILRFPWVAYYTQADLNVHPS